MATKIVWEGSPTGEYSSETEEILLPKYSKWKRHLPEVIAHEIGHKTYGHIYGMKGSLEIFIEEIDAWRFALKKLPPQEIDVGFIKDALTDYLDDVNATFGYDSPEYLQCKSMMDEVLSKARKKSSLLEGGR